MKRIFLNTDQTISAGARVRLPADIAHHLSVLRAKDGDRFLFTAYPAPIVVGELSLLSDGNDLFGHIEHTNALPEPPIRVHTAFCALMKGDRNETIIEKLSEIGVHRIVFFEAARSIVKGKKIQISKKERFLKLARASAEQCGRATPIEIEVTDAKELQFFFSTLPSSGKRIIAALTPDAIPLDSLREVHHPYSIAIGPEGDFTANEVTIFIDAHFVPVSLGASVLRSDTAAITLSAQCSLLASLHCLTPR